MDTVERHRSSENNGVAETWRRNVCPVCGHQCKPRGLGAHMRLKHSLKIKTVVKGEKDLREKVRRQCDYVKKKERAVVETRFEKAPLHGSARKVGDPEVEDIIKQINAITREAQDRAVQAGEYKEAYMRYVKDPNRMGGLLRRLNVLLS